MALNDEQTALDITEPFFAPSTEGALDHLFSLRDAVKAKIEGIANFMDGDIRAAMDFYLDAYRVKNRDRGGSVSVSELMDIPRAVAALDANLWSRAMDLTDVYDCMPQARRTEWQEQIREHKTPEFLPDNVLPTFEFLLTSRAKFFAERVDGIFRSLSRSHVTNRPEGFSKRMIIPYVLSEYGGHPEYQRAGTINDLRCVIARFMGRDEPRHDESSRVVRIASEQPGRWTSVDGGALRIRVYTGVRTAHLEVHPDMAWRLNAVLASLYPAAIPSQFREPPKKRTREFALMQKPLPFQVVNMLGAMGPAVRWLGQDFRSNYLKEKIPNALQFSDGTDDKHVRQQVEEVLRALGGVETDGYWHFDYPPADILNEVVCSGCIPDTKSHQFYPTPEGIAEEAVALAEIGPTDLVLEPSAGQGGIADHLPKLMTTCVEVSPLHCRILEGKGFSVLERDFLKMAPGQTFDRVVMNPPFSQGRWQAHLEHAARFLNPGGRIVAILPTTARDKKLLPGFTCHWAGVYENQFAGTSIAVTILVADKPA